VNLIFFRMAATNRRMRYNAGGDLYALNAGPIRSSHTFFLATSDAGALQSSRTWPVAAWEMQRDGRDIDAGDPNMTVTLNHI
jgi:hypothetical protein